MRTGVRYKPDSGSTCLETALFRMFSFHCVSSCISPEYDTVRIP